MVTLTAGDLVFAVLVRGRDDEATARASSSGDDRLELGDEPVQDGSHISRAEEVDNKSPLASAADDVVCPQQTQGMRYRRRLHLRSSRELEDWKVTNSTKQKEQSQSVWVSE